MDGFRQCINADNLILVIFDKNGASNIEILVLALCGNKVVKSLYLIILI